MVKVKKYREDVCRTASLPLPWDRLAGKTILISGASGLIGTFLIDVLMCGQTGVRIVALGRNEEDAKKRFAVTGIFPPLLLSGRMSTIRWHCRRDCRWIIYFMERAIPIRWLTPQIRWEP